MLRNQPTNSVMGKLINTSETVSQSGKWNTATSTNFKALFLSSRQNK